MYENADGPNIIAEHCIIDGILSGLHHTHTGPLIPLIKDGRVTLTLNTAVIV